MRGAASSILCLCFLLTTAPSWVSSFQPSSSNGRFLSVPSPLHPSSGARPNFFPDENPPSQSSSANSHGGITSSTSLNSFMGSDGGLFGIGTPELATILLVGYFVLGPSDLYKLVKEIGKFIQNIRTLGTEATKTFENTMESQLELKEIRKAQQELNDAFSFRRSINVDTEAEVFSNSAATATGPVPETAAAAAGAAAAATSTPSATAATDTSEEAAAPPKRKKKRRRVKKKAPPTAVPEMESSTGNVPDLDMSDAFPAADTTTTTKPAVKSDDDWFADGFPSASDMAKEDMAWLAADDTNATTTTTVEPKDPAMAAAEQSRFQQQLSGNWNEKVLDNEDSLAPLAVIMEKLALLEEERAAADKRLEDEFRQRFQLEEDYYQKKRDLLEETAAKVQENAYVTMDSGSSDSKKK
ncbi:expressed unknown protein [Seminavis robusta]|uniref:Uncharacterized protein n=1 Tax=Seminavis robusta TaxID=568900 RepID=A0A9N8E4U5_9STRA|nr:expressed unknown protein [Seminavis robusta]|eukprot:Sro502_g155660.1 n/a (413) ;mRNA; r:54246-55610